MSLRWQHQLRPEKPRTIIRRFLKLADNNYLRGRGSAGEDKLWSQLRDQNWTLTDVGRRINTNVPPLSSQLEALMQAVKKIAKGVEMVGIFHSTFRQ